MNLNVSCCRGWWKALGYAQFVWMLLSIVNLCLSEWVVGEAPEPWRGSLKKVIEGDGRIENHTYSQLSECDTQECRLFETLNKTGSIFIIFQSSSLVFALISGIFTITVIMGMRTALWGFLMTGCSIATEWIACLWSNELLELHMHNCQNDYQLCVGTGVILCVCLAAFALGLFCYHSFLVVVLKWEEHQQKTFRETRKQQMPKIVVVEADQESFVRCESVVGDRSLLGSDLKQKKKFHLVGDACIDNNNQF